MTTTDRPQYRHLGQRQPRVEGPGKVTGETVYAGDVFVPRMLHAKLVLSPYPHARIVRIDPSAALAVDGVVQVITSDDLERATVGGNNPAVNASNRSARRVIGRA